MTREVCSPPLTPPTFKIFKTINVVKYKKNRETTGKLQGKYRETMGNEMIGNIGSFIGSDIRHDMLRDSTEVRQASLRGMSTETLRRPEPHVGRIRKIFNIFYIRLNSVLWAKTLLVLLVAKLVLTTKRSIAESSRTSSCTVAPLQPFSGRIERYPLLSRLLPGYFQQNASWSSEHVRQGDFPTFLEALEHWNPSSIHQVEASSWASARTDAISAREPIVILFRYGWNMLK